MSVQAPIRVVLDITRNTATISGHLAIDGATTSRFYGWLELIDALDRVVGPPPEARPAVEGDRQ